MKHLISFNESIKDKMTPKSDEKIKEGLDKLSPFQALAKSKINGITSLISGYEEKTKPIIDKLYKDIKKFDRNNIEKFIEFICEWIDEQQYGASNQMGIDDKFESIMIELGRYEEEYDEYDDEEEIDEFDVERQRASKAEFEKSIFSDKTIELFKQMVVSYVIDCLSNRVYEREDDYDEYDDEEYEVDEDRRRFARGEDEEDEEDEEDIDSDYIDIYISDVVHQIGVMFEDENIDIENSEIEKVLYNYFEEEMEEAFDTNIPEQVIASNIKSSEKFIQKMGLDKKSKSNEETTENKPINKIKKFLGFDDK